MPALCSVIIFTVVLAQLHLAVNTRYAGPLYIPDNINPEDFVNEMESANARGGYIESWPLSKELENTDAALSRKWEKLFPPAESLKAIEEESKSLESPAEPLPLPAALVNTLTEPAYKKSGSSYYMSLCHFKICNMGRKRNTRYLHLSDLMNNERKIKAKNLSAANAM